MSRKENIMDFISWCNINQGFLMVLLTFIYVFATIVIMFLTKQSIDSNKNTLQEMKEARYASERPYVVMHFIYDENLKSLYLIVKNYGNSLAKIKRVNVEPELKIYQQSINSFLDNTLIAPNQSLHFLTDPSEKDRIYKGEKTNFVFKIKYLDLATKKEFNEDNAVDVSYIGQIISTRRTLSSLTESENAIMNIERAMHSIAINNLK